ncbi:DUF2239 family protein [Sphingomonas parva]|uniref:DUF2239 family protein n=1 Tax=Sphingomonas parva TaxID=2555898 RepID=A0A4Y8ZRN0_9SPHN|nr:DUF2239 family protein [Sphingomonas parva]TFI58698.1 DUF2239 family protein [Sphingomonas parva]
MTQHATAFVGTDLLARGPLAEVALAVAAAEAGGARPLTFSDDTGRVVDLDLRGSEEEIVARLAGPDAAPVSRTRGRPKLGVVAREVTLLPRHWEWLNAQPGGASQALRRLVEEARKGGAADPRQARERAYRFMSAMAGDLPGFEEATRALFAGDVESFRARMAEWPKDVAAYAEELAGPNGNSPPL